MTALPVAQQYFVLCHLKATFIIAGNKNVMTGKGPYFIKVAVKPDDLHLAVNYPAFLCFAKLKGTAVKLDFPA